MPTGRKRLGYLDQTGRPQEAHAAHWAGFRFTGGPWRVQCWSPAGKLQVWASSEAEGQRVIRHALVAAGVSPDDPGNTWSAHRVTHPRYKTVRTYETAVFQGAIAVTKRPGPDGCPEV